MSGKEHSVLGSYFSSSTPAKPALSAGLRMDLAEYFYGSIASSVSDSGKTRGWWVFFFLNNWKYHNDNKDTFETSLVKVNSCIRILESIG